MAGDGVVRLEDGTELRVHTNSTRGAVSVGVRPEKISLGGDGANRVAGKVKESAYIGVATEVVVATPVGELTVFHQNVEAGGVAPAAGSPVTLTWAPEATFVVERKRGAERMTSRITRRELVQRGAAGATLLSFPGLLAACGGGGAVVEAAARSRTCSGSRTGRYYIDFVEETKKHPTLDEFTAKTGIKVDYFEDINDNAQYFGKIQGPLSQGRGIDRDIIVLTDNSRFPGLMITKGWVEELDKDLIPNITNLVDAQASPPFDPDRTYSLPWQSGMTGIAWNEDVTGPVTSIQQLLEDPKLKGKVTMLMEMADSVGVVMLQNGDDPKTVTDASFDKAVADGPEGGRQRPDPPLHRERLRPAARERRPRGGRRVVGRHRAASPVQPEAQVGDPRVRRDDLDGQHADPEGRQRADGVDVHELRLRPRRRREDRRLHPVRDAGQGGAGGAGEDRPRHWRRARSSSRPTRCSGSSASSTRRRSATRTTSRNGNECSGHREFEGTDAVNFLHRHKGLTPYLLLLPGIAWLAVFFLVPLALPRLPVAASRARSRAGTRSTGRSRTTGTRSPRTTSS